MVVLNAALYFSEEDGQFVSHGAYEFPQIGLGETEHEAMFDLEKAVKQVIDAGRKGNKIVSGDPGFSSEVGTLFNKAILDDRDPDFIKRIEGYAELHYYDLGIVE